MDCYNCRRSPWLQEKVLFSLQNFLLNFNERITDKDFFEVVECEGMMAFLNTTLRELLPRAALRRLSLPKRHDLLDDSDDEVVTPRRCLTELWNNGIDHEIFRDIFTILIDFCLKHPWGDPKETDIFHNRSLELQRALQLTDFELDILLVALALDMRILWDPRTERDCAGRKLYLIAHFLGRRENEVTPVIAEHTRLRRYGCLDSDLDLSRRIDEFLCGISEESICSRFFRRDDAPTLPWTDFSDLTRKHGTILKRLLASKAKPVNILLYGAPGTGKTSFARTLAKEDGRDCFVIVQNTNKDDEDGGSTPAQRFGALQICNDQVDPAHSLIIVDEADDMLRSNSGNFRSFFGGGVVTGDKGLLNSVLDHCRTSTIWITNTPAEALDESSRRRFDYSIFFAPLDTPQRKRIWHNNIHRLKLGRLISSRQVEEFASLYPVSAGGISLTLENLAALHPKKSEVGTLIAQLMAPHCELMGIPLTTPELRPANDYSLEGLNLHGNVELNRIVAAVGKFQTQLNTVTLDPDHPRMNLLLSGPPGTGKTEFVKYLAHTLHTRICVRMGSDLLSKFVGGTEQNIRDAFAAAANDHAILFLDELDGLVQNRVSARNSWEVTQVNELLQQMENFNGVMIGATNFLANLDRAILRRFTFKIEFDYLDDDGKVLFFERMFHTPLTAQERARLIAIPDLAPGDFRTVRQSLFYYCDEPTNDQRLDALLQEVAAKKRLPASNAAKIGF